MTDHDEILDEMDSDDMMDDMLDDLADDMMTEMSQDKKVTPPPPQSSVARVSAPQQQQQMPDLGALMSQMMPMMNQMLGGGQLQHPKVVEKDWKDCLSSEERQEWTKIIERDLRQQIAEKDTFGPFSRSYGQKPTDSENGTSVRTPMCLEWVLVSIVKSAIAHSRCKPLRQLEWNTLTDALIAQHFARTKMHQSFYDDELKRMLQQRIRNDRDFSRERFPSTAAVLID